MGLLEVQRAVARLEPPEVGLPRRSIEHLAAFRLLECAPKGKAATELVAPVLEAFGEDPPR